ncbi:MAG: hypothetical protein RIR07_105, partial [Bacteroidota bacterium]
MVRKVIFVGLAVLASWGSRWPSACADAGRSCGALAGARGLTGPEALAGANGLANSTRSAKADTLVFVWWNLQNLFDTVANSGPRDRDFLPDGPYRWDSKRYYTKLYAVGRGLAAAAGGRIPDAIGVCEVENADVLDDLERRWP